MKEHKHATNDQPDTKPAHDEVAKKAYAIRDNLIAHKQYLARHGEDVPEIRNWTWSGKAFSRLGS